MPVGFFLFVASGLSLLVAITAGVWGLVWAPDSHLSAYIQAAALMAATSGWIFNNATTLQVKSREKAFDFLDLATVDDKATALLRPVAQGWQDPELKKIAADPERAANWVFANKGVEGSFAQVLQNAANYFESMAIGIRRGAIDEQMLKDYYQFQLCRFWTIYSPFLPAIRNAAGWRYHNAKFAVRTDIAEHAEWLHRRWCKG
jgi:hypothetical protein